MTITTISSISVKPRSFWNFFIDSVSSSGSGTLWISMSADPEGPGWFTPSVSEQARPHGLSEVEDREVESQEDDPDHASQHDDRDRLDQSAEPVHGRGHPLLVEVRRAPQHRVELAGLFAGRGHLHQHLGKDLGLAHGPGERNPLLDLGADLVD